MKMRFARRREVVSLAVASALAIYDGLGPLIALVGVIVLAALISAGAIVSALVPPILAPRISPAVALREG
jgi:hypothetical protein